MAFYTYACAEFLTPISEARGGPLGGTNPCVDRKKRKKRDQFPTDTVLDSPGY